MENINKKEILIVDDSATNLFLLESVLNEYDYKAITANSAKEALKIIDNKHPDLILIDILMPQISGFELIKTIKLNPLLGSIPIFAVSAITEEESIREIIDAGANIFINKPIIISELLDKIKDIFIA